MSQVPSSRDRLARLSIQPLAAEKQHPTAGTASNRADTALGIARRPDRVDVSASASRAGAELAQRLQSVRDALRDAAHNAEPAPGVEAAQDHLNRSSDVFRRTLDADPAGSRNGRWFNTREGGVFFQARFNSIDLEGITSKFSLQVAGSLGSKQLSFASGTSLASITAAINSFTDQTGVRADYRADKGIEIRRNDPTGFTSIHVIDDGGLSNGGFSVVP